MAKRSQVDPVDDEDANDDWEDGATTPTKRRKISTLAQLGNGHGQANGHGHGQGTGNGNGNGNGYSSHNHDDDNDAQEAAADDEVDGNEDALSDPAIQRQEQRRSRKLTTCAEAGVIESVSLVNFMCHGNLTIDLGPNMNFIIGHNGSGKSAILTAITVCLGGKAASSGRGSSLKSFVKNGRPQSTVTIKLKNRGADAYNHALYGDSIIIERKFGAEGGGGYLIKGADRQIHAKRREDLDAITDHFGLAIENPMNVLSQDTARQFLANATPRTLYDLFMKGIELQQLEADHNLLSENIESTNATLVARGRSLDKLREQEEEAAKVYAETHRAREAQNEFDLMKDKMAWIQVRDVERHRDEMASKVNREQGFLDTLAENITETNDKLANIRSEIAKAEEEMVRLTTIERKPIEDRHEEQKDLFDEGKNDLQRFMTDQRECHSHIKRQDKTIDETKKAIQRETAALAENEAGVQNARMLREKSELDEKLGGVRDEISDVEAQYNDVGIDIAAKKRELESSKQDIMTLEAAVDSQNERLHGIQRASQNGLAAFHQNMDRLLKTIEEAEKRGRWQEKPIGPLGRTMTLQYPEWSDIVENFWGARINGFLVSTYSDKQVLLRMMNDCGVRGCPVLQGKDTLFPIDEPEARFLTVLRAVEWSNERVMRQLIITNHPESALLIKDRREAELTMDPLNPPKNAARAFAIDPEDPCRGFVIGGGARGSSMQQTTNAYRHPKRLTRSSEADLDQCRIALATAQEKLRSAKEIQRLLEAKIRQLEQQKGSLHNRRTDLLKLQQRLSKQLEKLKDDLETAQAVDDGKLQGLNESLEAAKQQKEVYEGQYRTILHEKSLIEESQRRIKEELDKISEELEDFDEKLGKLQPRLLELTTDVQELSKHRQHFERQRNERTDKKADYDRRLAAAQEVVNDHTNIASQICARVEIGENESTNRLQRLLEDKQRAIARIRQRYGGQSEAQIAERLATARDNLEVASREVEELRNIIAELSTALVKRQASRKKFQKLICMRAKQNFVRHLSERDFTGRLSFKHEAKELHTHVTPADVAANMKKNKDSNGSNDGSSSRTKKTGKASDNKVLSGGEKSFTTICLLLSIWEAMGCPIRALDEFDVFMDSVNRGISMKMMIDSANESIDKQFIVITPQDMGGVKPTPTTKIHKLADPARGVTRVDSTLQE